MVCKIYFIRNAESMVDSNSRRTVGGYSNFLELTDDGVKESKSLGNNSQKEGLCFDLAFSSPSIRAQQTARYVIENLENFTCKVVLDNSLLELDQGDWEGQVKDKVYGRDDVISALNEDCWNFVPGDTLKGESQRMVAERLKRWVLDVSKYK